MSRFRRFLDSTTVPWIDLGCLECLHYRTVNHRIYFLWLGERIPQGITSRRMPVQPQYRISQFSRYFAQRRVFYFHGCAHGTRYQRMLRVSTFPRTADGAMDSSDASNVYIGWTSYDIYFLWLDTAGRAKTRRMPAQPQYRISDAPDISLNDVSFTSMTVHMAVYAADRCYEFRRFLGTHHGTMDSDASNGLHHGSGRSYNIYFLWLGKNTAGISENSAVSVRPPYRIFPTPRYFFQRRVLQFHDCAHGDGLRRR
jgi:hypothetical protein